MRRWPWRVIAGVVALGYAGYVALMGVSVFHFRKADVANGYPVVCLQKATYDQDERDDYSCTQSSGLHMWAGREIYTFLHDGSDEDFVLVCETKDRVAVQHFGYYTYFSASQIEEVTLTCGL